MLGSRKAFGMKSNSRRSAFSFHQPALATIGALLLWSALFAFGLMGISVAGESPQFREHVWVPRTLAIASGFLLATTLFRLVRRLLFISPKRWGSKG
jgi:hypothetical protein